MPETIEHNGKVRQHQRGQGLVNSPFGLLCQFLIPWARVGRTRDEAYDPEVGERVWTWLQDAVTKFEKSLEGET